MACWLNTSLLPLMVVTSCASVYAISKARISHLVLEALSAADITNSLNCSVSSGQERCVFNSVRMTLAATKMPPIAASYVFSVRYGFQVCGVNAMRIAAEVIQFFIIGDRADNILIGKSMSEHKCSRSVNTTANTKKSVTLLVGRPRPAAAKIWSVLRNWPQLINLWPKTIRRCNNWPYHKVLIIPSEVA